MAAVKGGDGVQDAGNDAAAALDAADGGAGFAEDRLMAMLLEHGLVDHVRTAATAPLHHLFVSSLSRSLPLPLPLPLKADLTRSMLLILILVALSWLVYNSVPNVRSFVCPSRFGRCAQMLWRKSLLLPLPAQQKQREND